MIDIVRNPVILSSFSSLVISYGMTWFVGEFWKEKNCLVLHPVWPTGFMSPWEANQFSGDVNSSFDMCCCHKLSSVAKSSGTRRWLHPCVSPEFCLQELQYSQSPYVIGLCWLHNDFGQLK
jgi:hypothetical protein